MKPQELFDIIQRLPLGTYDKGRLYNYLISLETISKEDIIKYVGKLEDLTTTNKDNIVSAINELKESSEIIKVTYEELKILRDNNNLKPGCLYRITDYVATVNLWEDRYTSAGHPFDIIVLATSESTLSEEAKAIQHEGDTYFANSNLAAWKIRYCLDNDVNRFIWAENNKYIVLTFEGNTNKYYRDSYNDNPDYDYGLCWVSENYDVNVYTNTEYPKVGDICVYGNPANTTDESQEFVEIEEVFVPKGIIYRMIDEFNNDAPYDFKNIQFYRKYNDTYQTYSDLATSEDGIAAYTFSNENPDSTNKFTDMSMQKDNGILNNIINTYIIGNNYELPNNCFFGNNNRNNILKSNCKNNTFGEGNSYNILENNCEDNIFISDNSNNVIEPESYNCVMVFANSNIIKYQSGIIELIDSNKNIIGTNNYNIKLNNSSSNIFEFNNFNITLKNSSYNTFKNNCNNIIFASDAAGESAGRYFNNNIIGSNVSNVILYNASTASDFQVVKNYNIKSGIEGTDSNPIVIEATRNLDYITIVAKKSNGNIVKYCEADLIADQN